MLSPAHHNGFAFWLQGVGGSALRWRWQATRTAGLATTVGPCEASTETEEIPTIEKATRTVEEVTVRPEATGRTEIARDTARREEVEIEGQNGPPPRFMRVQSVRRSNPPRRRFGEAVSYGGCLYPAPAPKSSNPEPR
jgi:Domain of unknown function (DUF2382)